MAEDLKMAIEALQKKKSHYDKLWAYYDGNQPLVYSSERLKNAFSGLNSRFSLNWCAVVVDSVMERMEFKSFVVNQDEGSTVEMNRWWEESGMNLDADDVELCAMVTGEAFVLVWPGEDEGTLEAYYNDSRMVHAFYHSDRPREMRFAAKWYQDEEDKIRLTLYYSDRLEYYISKSAYKDKSTSDIKSTHFEPLPGEDGEDNVAVNPLKIIPVFHFRRERRAIASEMTPAVLDTQDAINKLLADMMVSSEYGAFKQRYIISQAEPGDLKNSPNEIWDLPAGDGVGQDTSVGQFQETNLRNFMDSIEQLSTAIAKMTRTPQYYFFLGARQDPSGETLYAMDGPLIKKTEKYIKRFKREWKLLGRFVADQINVGFDEMALMVEYADPSQAQPLTQAQTRDTNVRAGVPLATQLRREGWTPQELEQLQTDKEAERQSQANSLAQALLDQQRGFDGE